MSIDPRDFIKNDGNVLIPLPGIKDWKKKNTGKKMISNMQRSTDRSVFRETFVKKETLNQLLKIDEKELGRTPISGILFYFAHVKNPDGPSSTVAVVGLDGNGKLVDDGKHKSLYFRNTMPSKSLQDLTFDEGSELIESTQFGNWKKTRTGIDLVPKLKNNPFTGVFLSVNTLNEILNIKSSAINKSPLKGIAFYQSLLDTPKLNTTTLAAFGVDQNGKEIISADHQPFYIGKPCPPYCPPWQF